MYMVTSGDTLISSASGVSQADRLGREPKVFRAMAVTSFLSVS